MTNLQKLSVLLSKQDKYKLYLLLIPMIITALISMVGVAAVMPFIGVVVHPKMIQTNATLNKIYHYLSFVRPLRFTLLLGIAALVSLVVANILSATTLWFSGRILQGINARLSHRLYGQYLDKPYEFHLQNNSARLRTNLRLAENVTNGYLTKGALLITNILLLVVLLGFIVWVNLKMALVMGASIGGSYGIIYWLVKHKLNRAGELYVESNNKCSQLENESFGGIKHIKLKHNAEVFKQLFFPLKYQVMRSLEVVRVLGQIPKYAIEVVIFGGVVLIHSSYLVK